MPVMDFPSSPINGQTTTDGRYYFDSSVGSSGAWRSAPLPVGGLPAGSIMAWGTNTPPANWLLADGSAVSRTVYSSLFAVIGTTYGAGDGSTTFALPDLRGRVPVGKNGATFGTLGATGGAETHTLTTAEMPSHTHTQDAHGHVVSANSFAGDRQIAVGPLGGDGDKYSFGDSGNDASTSTANIYARNTTATNQNTGGGQAHNNVQPYQVVNYIIKASAGWTAGDSELATRVGSVEARATALEAGIVNIPATNITSGTLNSSRLPAGTVLQVVTKRYAGRPVFTISGDTVISYLNTSITPKSASSLLIVSFQISGEVTYNCVYRGYRDGSLITNSGYWGYNEENGAQESGLAVAPYDGDLASTPHTQQVTYFVPSYSTAATTLQISARTTDSGSASFALNRTLGNGGTTAYENLVSNCVIWEIAQ